MELKIWPKKLVTNMGRKKRKRNVLHGPEGVLAAGEGKFREKFE